MAYNNVVSGKFNSKEFFDKWFKITERWRELSECQNCKNPDWIRKTQFSGNFEFCDEHAREEEDFGKSDPSYFYWEKIIKKRNKKKWKK